MGDSSAPAVEIRNPVDLATSAAAGGTVLVPAAAKPKSSLVVAAATIDRSRSTCSGYLKVSRALRDRLSHFLPHCLAPSLHHTSFAFPLPLPSPPSACRSKTVKGAGRSATLSSWRTSGPTTRPAALRGSPSAPWISGGLAPLPLFPAPQGA